jgi:hypothetical protein
VAINNDNEANKATSQAVCAIEQSMLLRCLWEQHTLKNGNKCLHTNIYSYLETSGGQSSILYLNVGHFFNISVKYTSAAA